MKNNRFAALIALYLVCGSLYAQKFEAGRVETAQASGSQWHTVTLDRYDAIGRPIVVMGPPTRNGTHPATVRVRNIAREQRVVASSAYYARLLPNGGTSRFSFDAVTTQPPETVITDFTLNEPCADSCSVDYDIIWSEYAAGTDKNGEYVFTVDVTVTNHSSSEINGYELAWTMGPSEWIAGYAGDVFLSSTYDPYQFQFQLDEWDYLDGKHKGEVFHYFAAAPGRHLLPNEMVMIAGRVAKQNHEWKRVDFETPFNETPVVLVSQTTSNGADATTVRLRNVDNLGFELRLQEEEANDDRHTREAVDYIAITPGSAHPVWPIEVGRTGSSMTHQWGGVPFTMTYDDQNDRTRPALLASMQTYNGSDTAALRYKPINNPGGWAGASFMVEEEQSADSETRHTGESVGWMVIGGAALK